MSPIKPMDTYSHHLSIAPSTEQLPDLPTSMDQSRPRTDTEPSGPSSWVIAKFLSTYHRPRGVLSSSQVRCIVESEQRSSPFMARLDPFTSARRPSSRRNEANVASGSRPCDHCNSHRPPDRSLLHTCCITHTSRRTFGGP